MKTLKTTMHVLYPDGDVATGVIEAMPQFPGLDATRAMVEPHLQFTALVNERLETIKPGIEYVSVLYGGKPCSMFVDDEGAFAGARSMHGPAQCIGPMYCRIRLRQIPSP